MVLELIIVLVHLLCYMWPLPLLQPPDTKPNRPIAHWTSAAYHRPIHFGAGFDALFVMPNSSILGLSMKPGKKINKKRQLNAFKRTEIFIFKTGFFLWIEKQLSSSSSLSLLWWQFGCILKTVCVTAGVRWLLLSYEKFTTNYSMQNIKIGV